MTTTQNPRAYRLPATARPAAYHIDVDARMEREEFHGNVTIELDLLEPSKSIVLHSRDLDLHSIQLTDSAGTLEGTAELDPEREVATITFPELIPGGRATLEIGFEGRVSKGLVGLYLAQDGPERLLVTQTFATEARSVFPCFDEPQFKAAFSYEVTTSPDVTVLANSPLVSVEESQDGQTKTWTFAPTKPMSTYLTALALGYIEGTPEAIVNGVPTRVWALKGKEDMGRFAHDYINRLLPLYESYFGLPYHFDKYDQIAVPGFAAGAMENAGLVTFRQQLLLMNPQTASWNAEKRIAHVVAHEFAHMWFGDLATIKWWDDVWLSEAFAEWFSYKAVNTLNPDYEVWDDFQEAKNHALDIDALQSTHPIYSPVQTPAEALELFDTITYLKGCSVLRMLENYLGEEPFRAGIQSYMKEFFESNATSGDLWRNLQQASDEPVTAVMESWIMQGGYPIVSVNLQEGEGSAKLTLSQRRFFSTPGGPNDNDQLWQVPVVVRYEDDSGPQESRYLLAGREGTFGLPLSGKLKWLYANAGEIGFYRQNPEKALRDALLRNLDKLTPAEQMGLLSDQWALVRNGRNTISGFLDTLQSFAVLDNRSVLDKVVEHLHDLETMLIEIGDEDALTRFRDWVLGLFSAKLERLGLEPKESESQNDTQSRVHILDAMATLAQDPDVIREVTAMADREASDPASVSPDLAALIVGVAARFGDVHRYDEHVKIYRERREAGRSPQESMRYLGSLLDFRPPELVARTLGHMDDGTIPQENVTLGVRQMLGMPHAQLAAWEYSKAHIEDFKRSGLLMVGPVVENWGHLPADKREEIVSFYETNLSGIADKSFARALETMDQETEFKQRVTDGLLQWLKRS